MSDPKSELIKHLNTADIEKLDDTHPDLDRAFKVLKAKAPVYTDLWNYYDGDQPLMYTASRMRDLFENLDTTFVENWCAVVVDAANDRINLSSVSVKDEEKSGTLEETWQTLEVGLEASDVHEAAQVIGESFMLVWPNADEDIKIDAFYNDPRLVHLFYEGSNPRKKRYGAKWWVTAENFIRITLYYPERIEYYISTKIAGNVTSVKDFVTYSPDGSEAGFKVVNPYDEVPIFHFRTERRKIKGDLVNAIPLQNGINKLLTDMMVSAEFGAFKQRYVISNADTAKLKNSPNEIWEIPAGDGSGQSTEVGQFDETPLENFIKGIDHLATSMAIITRTPKHYLFQQGGTPSGEALQAMESPLVKRCYDHINKFIPVWKETIAFMLKILDSEVTQDDIVVTFDKAETILPKTQAEIRTENLAAGIPLETTLRDEGKSQAWIDQMNDDKAKAKKEDSNNMGKALAEAIRMANQPEEESGEDA